MVSPIFNRVQTIPANCENLTCWCPKKRYTSASVQRDLYADYQREQMTPKDLLKRLEHRKPKTDVDGERLLDALTAQARELSKMKKVDGVVIDAYRLTYLINLLKKL